MAYCFGKSSRKKKIVEMNNTRLVSDLSLRYEADWVDWDDTAGKLKQLIYTEIGDL